MKKTAQKHPKYFEGILQLRNPSEEVLNFIEQEFHRYGKPIISQGKKVASGYDLYLLSRNFLLGLVKKLKEKFGGIAKTSATLHTRSKTGKDLYRVTALFRLLKFKKGNVIQIGNDSLEIISIENQVMTKNIKSGEKKRFSLEEFERYNDRHN